MKRVTGFIAGLAIALACTNAQAFTAIALSNSTSRVGASMNAPSKEAAMSAAVENCKAHGGGSDCRVIELTEKRGYFAIFMTCDNGCSIGLVTGRASKEQARADAKRDCERNTGNACQLVSEWEERGYQAPVTAVAAPPAPPAKPPVAYKPAVQLDDNSRKKEKRTPRGLFLLGDATPGKVYKDCTYCPEMVNIPAGSFDMGASPENGGNNAQRPVHRVSVPTFAMSRTEVTVAQWAAFVRETRRPDPSTSCSAIIYVGGKSEVEGWRNPGYPQSDAHPVSCVDWHDAQAYVTWLSQKLNKPYRLPSEAEWEYAARAGSTTPYPWGNDPLQACNHGNIPDMTMEAVSRSPGANPFKCNDGQLYSAAVATYQANAFGLYDMIGNLEEWTADCWHPTYTGAPTDGSAWAENACTHRVTRGGSWNFYGNVSRRMMKVGDTDDLIMLSLPMNSARNVTLGFRVALSTDPAVVAQWRKAERELHRPAEGPSNHDLEFMRERERELRNECMNNGACGDYNRFRDWQINNGIH